MSNKINQISSSKNYGDTTLKDLVDQPYRYGFKTDIETEDFPRGLDETIVTLISQKGVSLLFSWNLDCELTKLGLVCLHQSGLV